MATVADGGAVSLSGPPLPASATPASTSQCHLLAADSLGENPFEVASSSTDGGRAPLLLQALLGAPRLASAVATERVLLVANGIPTIPKNLPLHIRRGEYVDFADLLPAVNAADESSALGGQIARSPCYRGTRWCAVAGVTQGIIYPGSHRSVRHKIATYATQI